MQDADGTPFERYRLVELSGPGGPSEVRRGSRMVLKSQRLLADSTAARKAVRASAVDVGLARVNAAWLINSFNPT